MIHRVGLVSKLVLTGGCAKNEALVRGLERALGEDILRLPTPQSAGALGAALFARDRMLKAEQG
jgi:activator of 2-hydroxyglutaryl-CoA dehydratase